MSEFVVRNGKYLSITHTIVDEAGQMDEQRDLPVRYVHGGDTQLLGDMDKAIAGHRVDDQVQLALPPDWLISQRDENLTFTEDIQNVPPVFRRVGAEVQIQNDRGDTRSSYVTRIEDGECRISGIHAVNMTVTSSSIN